MAQLDKVFSVFTVTVVIQKYFISSYHTIPNCTLPYPTLYMNKKFSAFFPDILLLIVNEISGT